MTASRREFLQLGLAVTGLATVTGQPFEEQLALPPPFPKNLLYDSRLPLSLEFVHAFGSPKSSARALQDGALHMWRSWPRPAAGSSVVPLCGLTGLDVMHKLEELALSKGHAVIFRGAHRRTSDGRMVHQLTGSDAILRHAGQLRSTSWVAGLADLVWQHPSRVDHVATVSLSGAAGDRSVGDESLLLSWIIAPSPRHYPPLWWR